MSGQIRKPRRTVFQGQTSHRRTLRVAFGLMLSVILAAPMFSAGLTPAQAADGAGLGQRVMIGVAKDGFSTTYAEPVSIVPSDKYPGTVRILTFDDRKCLASDTKNRVQWTGCNNDSSKNWVIEPLDNATNYAVDAKVDNTVAAANVRSGAATPRFVLRHYKYADRCLVSYGSGLFGFAEPVPLRGLTSQCSAAQTDAELGMQFSIVNDPSGAEWEFLRQQMVAGALALNAKKTDGNFRGNNLWVKPYNSNGDPIGVAGLASSDGYFRPEGIAIDPAAQADVIRQTAVTQDCSVGGNWWNILNRTFQPATMSIGVSKQRTDSFSFGLNGSINVEKEFKTVGTKVGVSVGANVEWGSSNSTTQDQSVSMLVEPGNYGMVTVSTSAVSLDANWKSGTAFNRPWKVDGSLAVAQGKNAGVSPSTTTLLNSLVQKSCLAVPETVLEPGTPVRVGLPDGRIAPAVGDIVNAQATFVEPGVGGGGPLDVRYQWYAGSVPIANQTGASYTVTSDVVGQQLSFKVFENGGAMRFESEHFTSQQTAPVVAAAPVQLGGAAPTVMLSEGIVGTPYSLPLHELEDLADTQVIDAASLPAGLAFDAASGVVSGTPTAAGEYLLSLLDEDDNPVSGLLRVDPAPTVFPAASGTVVRVGQEISQPLVRTPGTGASYLTTFLNEAGDPVPAPAGLTITIDAAGIPTLTGVPTDGESFIVRTVEQSPHPSAEDARAVSDDFQFIIDRTASLVPQNEDTVATPLGQTANLVLAHIAGADQPVLQGVLPAGLSYDQATGLLAGLPTESGTFALTLGPNSAGSSVTFDLVVYGVPEIAFARTDLAVESPGFSTEDAVPVDGFASWQIHAAHADNITAVVRRVGGADQVGWASTTVPRTDELDLDVLPTEPGDYVIAVSAENGSGVSTAELAFRVAAVAPDASDEAGAPGSAEASASSTSGKPLAQTGGSTLTPLWMIAAVGAVSGALALLWSRKRGVGRR